MAGSSPAMGRFVVIIDISEHACGHDRMALAKFEFSALVHGYPQTIGRKKKRLDSPRFIGPHLFAVVDLLDHEARGTESLCHVKLRSIAGIFLPPHSVGTTCKEP